MLLKGTWAVKTLIIKTKTTQHILLLIYFNHNTGALHVPTLGMQFLQADRTRQNCCEVALLEVGERAALHPLLCCMRITDAFAFTLALIVVWQIGSQCVLKTFQHLNFHVVRHDPVAMLPTVSLSFFRNFALQCKKISVSTCSWLRLALCAACCRQRPLRWAWAAGVQK